MSIVSETFANQHGGGGREAPRQALVVHERCNPSSDYFVVPALRRAGFEVRLFSHAQVPSSEELAGVVVVFVRYVPRSWVRAVERSSAKPARLILFMDDDVLDVSASAGMPLHYRYKLARLAAWRRRWLWRLGAELWVSTPFLQQKYVDWRPRLVLPSPVAVGGPACRVFYHGTASHGSEIEWLRPVMEQVLRRDERVTFEIVGGRDVYRLYRDLPRVTVVHPMKWPAYQRFLAQPGRDIGLVPQFDTQFNRARSYTKFLDIVSCGAVGVYASGSNCAEVVRHDVDGWVAEMDPDAWVDAIVALAGDEERRQSMLSNAQARVRALSE